MSVARRVAPDLGGAVELVGPGGLAVLQRRHVGQAEFLLALRFGFLPAQIEAAQRKSDVIHQSQQQLLRFVIEGLDGVQKMSKSLGNVVTTRAFIEKFGGQVLRQLLLSVHYRARIDWTDEVIERATQDVKRIHEFAVELQGLNGTNVATDAAAMNEVKAFMEHFTEELANDFNSAGALGQFFSFIRFVRRDVAALRADVDVAHPPAEKHDEFVAAVRTSAERLSSLLNLDRKSTRLNSSHT